jgi:hypothetical protein
VLDLRRVDLDRRRNGRQPHLDRIAAVAYHVQRTRDQSVDGPDLEVRRRCPSLEP